MTGSDSPPRLLEGAVAAVRAAGGYARANISRRREEIARYAHDVKLKLDEECQQIVQAELAARIQELEAQAEALNEALTGARDEARFAQEQRAQI